jgi:hypothetical protein
MSTKTTFKRVALVTVAAMGFGLLSVAPSTATTQTDTLAVSATANATAVDLGTAASTTLTQTFLGTNSDTMQVTVSLFSSPTGNSVMPTLTAQTYNSVNGLAANSGLIGTMMDTVTWVPTRQQLQSTRYLFQELLVLELMSSKLHLRTVDFLT